MTALREVIDRSDAMPADRGARKLKAGTARVLCATDLWPRSNRAIWRANALAQALGGRLLLLHVLTAAESPRATRRRGARARLVLGARARKIARFGGGAQLAVRTGPLDDTIADVAIEWNADLIVLGPYRKSFGDRLRGSTAERVVRKVDRPVLVVNRAAFGPYQHVLLTSDLSSMSGGIAGVTKELGLLEGSRASVVHALQHSSGAMLYMTGAGEPEMGTYLRSLSQTAADAMQTQLVQAGLNAERFSVFSLHASPFTGIEQIVQRVGSDLVVLGSSRFPLFKRVLVGSVAHEVLRRVKQDVLLISPAAVRRARRRASWPGRARLPSAMTGYPSRDDLGGS